jgi:hypothetical protein
MTELCDLANKYGTDKQSTWGYMPTYQRWLEPRRNETMVVLELGVYRGASLKMWRDFFPNAMIFGIDNDPAPSAVAGEARIKTFNIDGYNPDLLIPVLREIGPIDLFVDDALHTAERQLPTFERVFPHLAPGGIYAIEETRSGEMESLRAEIEKTEGIDRIEHFPAGGGYGLLLASRLLHPAKEMVPE